MLIFITRWKEEMSEKLKATQRLVGNDGEPKLIWKYYYATLIIYCIIAVILW